MNWTKRWSGRKKDKMNELLNQMCMDARMENLSMLVKRRFAQMTSVQRKSFGKTMLWMYRHGYRSVENLLAVMN